MAYVARLFVAHTETLSGDVQWEVIENIMLVHSDVSFHFFFWQTWAC